ncbi:hypothetical protein ARMGADRAFT_1038760 [Armillaria gallica]|uniref:Uncharacterized protein n=1 Tax=Armillaria gallica TaxID=47427 RepID=A0A2H3CGV9_ARMGA|nr:hypothetical protein ARMGADRAFT_1038760 [Armillaria gallica]
MKAKTMAPSIEGKEGWPAFPVGAKDDGDVPLKEMAFYVMDDSSWCRRSNRCVQAEVKRRHGNDYVKPRVPTEEWANPTSLGAEQDTYAFEDVAEKRTSHPLGNGFRGNKRSVAQGVDITARVTNVAVEKRRVMWLCTRISCSIRPPSSFVECGSTVAPRIPSMAIDR